MNPRPAQITSVASAPRSALDLALAGENFRDGYVAKPIDPHLFVSQLETYLSFERRARPRTAAFDVADRAARCTALTVDNLAVNLEYARGILEPNGYRVLTARGIADALALLRANSCALIISDACMSGETDFDFIRAVKADPNFRGIPSVFITSTMVGERDRNAGLAFGAASYLFRPIEPEAFLTVIEACLRETGKGGR